MDGSGADVASSGDSIRILRFFFFPADALSGEGLRDRPDAETVILPSLSESKMDPSEGSRFAESLAEVIGLVDDGPASDVLSLLVLCGPTPDGFDDFSLASRFALSFLNCL